MWLIQESLTKNCNSWLMCEIKFNVLQDYIYYILRIVFYSCCFHSVVMDSYSAEYDRPHSVRICLSEVRLCTDDSAHSARSRWSSKLQSSGFIFSPVSGVLCWCSILLTHQPCGNWFGVSCQDLVSWPWCRLRQAWRLKAFLNSLWDWGIKTLSEVYEKVMIGTK